MAATLTDEQQKEIDAHPNSPAEVIDPRTGRLFRLVPSDEYERFRDYVEQEEWHQLSIETLAQRLQEDA